jgi:gliding motility-associated-like protein
MEKLALAILLLLVSGGSQAQTYPFAQLTGSPQMDTRGWNLIGAARLGDTGGDADDLFNEMVLCEPNPFTRGACFYQKPIDISRCQKWVAEFDYRIYDGTGADGIAFCFLNQPPNAFTFGGNIGIPARPQGLMVILDTYLNCTRLFNERVPKLEIRYSDGQTTYGDNTESILECPIPAQPTSDKMDILRQPTYNRMKITYDEGNIKTYINGDYVLSGYYVVNYPAYFGFTASTGGFNDRHSIRNFTLYTFRPIDSPPNAGPDRVVCSGDEVVLGAPAAPNEPYVYSWYPTTGLDNPTSAQPKVRFVNETDNELTYTYFLTKDSVVSTNRCAYSDEVNITVLGKIAKAGPDLNLCSGQTEFINAQSRDGYAYAWSPTTGLTKPNDARTFIRLENHTNAPITYQYVLSVMPLASPACTVRDTLLVTIQPEGAISTTDVSLCSGDTVRLGNPPLAGVSYLWSPVIGLDNATAATPQLTLKNTTSWPQVFTYVLSTRNPVSDCRRTDTVKVTVLPELRIIGSRSVCPNVTGVVYQLGQAQTDPNYQWWVQGGTITNGQGTSRITIDWGSTNARAAVGVSSAQFPDCAGQMGVDINRVLKPALPESAQPDTICLAQASGIRYETTSTAGSVYTWGISGNGQLMQGQGTHAITVNWLGVGEGKVWINERSVTQTDVCEGVSDTLKVWIEPLPVPEDMLIKAVSTQVAQEHNVEVRFRISPVSTLRNPITISRRTVLPQEGDWAAIASLSRNDSLYTDPDQSTDSQVYEYRLEGVDRCNEPAFSVPHHSILLQGTGDEPNETVHLNWNAYSGWSKGVKQYEIWRKINEEELYSRYDTTGRNQVAWSKVNATDGYIHCYRIQAIEDAASANVSWSNEVCLEFEHPLFIPNVVTPNGDQWNDTWVIRNLELYPDHTLTIVNRYGQTILQTQQYRQDWSGEELSTGLYYYYLTTVRKHQHFRGWVQVLR